MHYKLDQGIDHILVDEAQDTSPIQWTVISTPEIPLTDSELSEMRARPVGAIATLREIAAAIREMPPTMRQMAPMMLFQWYALFCFWQYIVVSLSQSLYGTTEASSQAFRDAGLVFGRIGAFYNFIAFISAFVLVRFTHRHGPKAVHATCLVAAGVGLELGVRVQREPGVGVRLQGGPCVGQPAVMDVAGRRHGAIFAEWHGAQGRSQPRASGTFGCLPRW